MPGRPIVILPSFDPTPKLMESLGLQEQKSGPEGSARGLGINVKQGSESAKSGALAPEMSMPMTR